MSHTWATHRTFRFMGIELIHDKDPLALRVLCKGLFNMGQLGQSACLWRLQNCQANNTSHAFCIQTPGFDPTRLHRQSWLGTRFGLYARFFICADMYALFEAQEPTDIMYRFRKSYSGRSSSCIIVLSLHSAYVRT